ncbi:Mak10 subunit, NatC N-terminal acetyltransferase-domain-containing protein [Protomyces lactucae-debilis]|uniref:Mak10 subunit, NatC N-terminal acetyltransferase-domain-containing protein n=1 Tax=Protomyces lactucae-debilis TaxID=2754530 RepID=A0A1Y2EQR3_PROLT|nr:Mak10 subunit, NatC N-terminal acetyltransferase-domain-containing protein [Protomyces lactucae-debilis]ORY73889.1 Mak10 subunit, NatC N-terminal acetyltransferase-domain-containing protein [Protomyces lactucae-debilis]
MSSHGITDMTDVTAAFKKACEDALDLGELIRLETFQLQDSIAALEIMDPKMDNGVIDAKELALGSYDCSQALSPQEVLSIMDQLLASEMAWQTGASLAQTLFTCVYVQALLGPRLQDRDPSKYRLDDPLHEHVLFPYVAATIRSCEFVREEFMAGRLYDEEDISAHDFDERMLSDEPSHTIQALLTDGIAWCKAQQLDHLALRLQQRQAWLQLTSQMSDATALQLNARTLESLLTEMTIPACTLKPDTLAAIFNPTIQRRFASTTPPRPIVTMSVEAAVDLLKRLCADMAPLKVISSDARHSPAVMHAYFEVLRCRELPYLPLTRSLMQRHFQESPGLKALPEQERYLINAVQELSGKRPEYFDASLARVEQPSDKRFKIHQLITMLLQRATPPILDLYRIYWHNPSRQRRNLCKVLLDLDVLQGEAELLDTELASLTKEHPKQLTNGRTSLSYTLSSWLFNTKLDVSLKIWFMGFEQELYRPWELDLVYLQLEHLIALQIDHLNTIYLDRVPASDQKVRDHLDSVITYNEVLIVMCRACIDLLKLLKKLKLIQDDRCPFSSRALLYEYRMKPFNLLVSPPALTWQDTRSCLDTSDLTAQQLKKNAADGVHQGRLQAAAAMKSSPSPLLSILPEVLDHQRAEMKAMVATCISNNLFLSQLSQQMQTGKVGSTKLAIRYPFTKHFPVFGFES